jgi:hypothetical protein
VDRHISESGFMRRQKCTDMYQDLDLCEDRRWTDIYQDLDLCEDRRWTDIYQDLDFM